MEAGQNTVILIFSGVLASVVSAVISALLNIVYKRRTERQQLKAFFWQFPLLFINEPFLENDTSLENHMTDDEKENESAREKYNKYCTIKYKCLDDFCRCYKYNLSKIEKKIRIREMLNDNKNWLVKNREFICKNNGKGLLSIIDAVIKEA